MWDFGLNPCTSRKCKYFLWGETNTLNSLKFLVSKTNICIDKEEKITYLLICPLRLKGGRLKALARMKAFSAAPLMYIEKVYFTKSCAENF